MSKQTTDTGYVQIVKSYLAQRYFSQYVSGFIAIIFIGMVIAELNSTNINNDSLMLYITIIIIMLIVNVFLGRESIVNDNKSDALVVEKKRRTEPTTSQQIQNEFAKMKDTLPAKEDLVVISNQISQIKIALEFQKDERDIIDESEKMKEELERLKEEVENTKKESL